MRRRKVRTFCFWKTSFVQSRSGTYYALLLGYFGMKFLPNIVIMSTEFWLRFEPLIFPTGFAINFLSITVRTKRKVHMCLKLFDFFPRWILISRFYSNSIETLTWNLWKKLSGRIFQKFYWKPRLSSFETCENSEKYFHMCFAPS